MYDIKNYKSVYYYNDCDVLKNKFNIKDDVKLEKVERIITTSKVMELNQNPIRGNFDLKHLQKIHKFIFNDVYEWAGKIRTEEITKGNTNFAPTPYILDGMKEQIFDPLKKEKFLKGLNAEDISKRLAYYYSELNFAHPFREGNGRTQREFIKNIAAKNGFDLDWNKANPDKLMRATISATMGSDMKSGMEELSKIILNCFDSREPNKDLIKDMNKFFDIGRDR